MSRSAAVALLLSGGGGRRLWPLSTDAQPKQFLRLFGEHSLYQRALARLSAARIDAIAVVANAAHECLLQEQTRDLGIAPVDLVLEPARRDSAPAIALGVALVLAEKGPHTTVFALPCDHLVADDEAFARALADGASLAQLGYLATFGLRPTSPATEYGYIQRGRAISRHPNAFAVVKFHEKPSLERALGYVGDDSFAWNSGMFAFRADVFASEAERWMPDVWHAALAAVRAGVREPTRLRPAADAFMRAPRISIDYALFEKSDRVAVVPVAFAWSDVGNWQSVHAALDKDGAGNAALGDARLRDATGSLVVAQDVKVIVIGVEDLVVIASPHGTFVAPLSRAAEVKALIEE